MPRDAAGALPQALRFLQANARWLAAGFLLALGSSFGQTYFIAIFGDAVRAEYGLSHGEWGWIYATGTTASAIALIQLGRRADDMDPRILALTIIVAFAAVCLGMALIASVWALPFLIFGLRLCGQGLLSHLSQTLTARWFAATRGKALAVASFGYPTGEALAPIAAVALIGAIGWRPTWGVAAALLLFALAPALWLLLARNRRPAGDAEDAAAGAGLRGRHWTRGEAVRSTPFWLILLGLLSPSFIITVVFFLPAHIAETKGWSLEDWAASYAIYAATAVAASFVVGWAIDRFSARALLPLYQLPMAVALLILAYGQSSLAMIATMVWLGLSAGAAATMHGAILAELFGARHLGAIKALGHAAMVFGSAAGPGVVGQLLDFEIAFATQAVWMAGYVVAVSALYLVVQPLLRD